MQLQTTDKHSSVWRLAIALLALCLAACGNLAGPAYERPDTPVKSGWSLNADDQWSAQGTIRLDWWANFNDPYLNEMMASAVANNQDLKVLAARTGVAEAAISQANAARLPTIDTSLAARTVNRDGGGSTTTYSQASAIGWELDVWGKAKKGVQAQEADYLASEADWRAGYLALAADLSSVYFQLRQYDDQIRQQEAAVARNEQIARIYRLQHGEGLVPETLVMKQEAEINGLTNDLIELQRLRGLSENALATLTGSLGREFSVPPGSLNDSLDTILVPAGLPSDLLTRRPDIIAAEYRVLEAHNLEGQARLAKLPSVSLTSGTGTTSNALNDLLKSWTFGLSPTVNIPIFDPSVNARLKVSEASTDLAEEEYRAVVVRAFEEVENALLNLEKHQQQRLELHAQRQRLRTIARQVEAQLNEGMVSQLEVLEAERSVLSAEQELLLNKQLILSDTVALYKALGGGWPAESVAAAGQAVPATP